MHILLYITRDLIKLIMGIVNVRKLLNNIKMAMNDKLTIPIENVNILTVLVNGNNYVCYQCFLLNTKTL